MAKPIIITIPPFMTEDGEYPAFWAWVMIAFLVIFYVIIG